MTILEVVESQRASLTDKDSNVRLKAMNKINTTIKENTLNVREVAVLTEFYRERLKDSWEVHGSVLQGMIYLSQQPKYPGSAISRLLPTLNQELHVQTLSIENRKVCVKFFTEIFNRHEQWIVQVGPEFCNLVIQSFDGETDPRVLLNGFNLLAKMQVSGLPGATDKSDNLWEELLDVCACYFPVDFEPDGTDSITREDLVGKLNDSLTGGIRSKVKTAKKKHTATLLDLILEKLQSDSKLAITDSIELMCVALGNLEKKKLDEKLNEILQTLVIIVGQRQQEPELQPEPLDAIKKLGQFYASYPDMAKKGLDFLYELTNEYLEPPYKPALWPTIKIFAAWSYSGVNVLERCLPSLIKGLQHPSSIGEALDSIVELANVNSTGETNEILDKILLDSIKNKEVSLQTKLLSISAVAACAKANLITLAGLEAITIEVFDLATKSDSMELCREAAHCLSFIGEKNPNFIKTKILPKLDGDALKKETFVLLLCQFVTLDGFMPLEISQKLIKIVHDRQYDKAWDDSVSAALSGMRGMIPQVKSPPVLLAIAKCFLMEIMDGLIQGVMFVGQDKNKTTSLMKEKSLEDICYLTRFLCLQLDKDFAGEFRADLWNKFTQAMTSRGNGATKVYFKPFEASYAYSHMQSKILPFLTSCMCSITPSTIPANMNEFTEFCLRVLSDRTAKIEHIKCVAKIMASIVNKNENIDESIWKELNQFCHSHKNTEKGLTLTIWITKGILLKGGKDLETWIDRLLLYASTTGEISRISADAWWLLLGETADLSSETNAVIKLLHPQRLFGMSLKKIKLAMDEETVGKEGLPPTAGKRGIVKENMLIILGHLLSLVPSEVQSRELPPLLPLLFEALSSTEDGLVDSALITLTQLQSNQSDEIIKSLETHLETIIEKFIKIVYSKLSLRSDDLKFINP